MRANAERKRTTRSRLSITLPEGVRITEVSTAHPEASFRVLAAMPGADENAGFGVMWISTPDVEPVREGAPGRGVFTPIRPTSGVDRGTYTLVIALAEPATIEVGALGERRFPSGWYAYTGSAFGPGGLSRVDRHRELARDEREVRHWYVDYLLGHPAASIDTVVVTERRDVECVVAGALPLAGIAGFGASDCDCPSHLAYADDRQALLAAVERAHGRA